MSTAALSISVQVDAPLVADVVFLPTDGRGTPGLHNTTILKQLNLPERLPDKAALAKGYAIEAAPAQAAPVRFLCYIVNVSGKPARVALQTNLALALADPLLATVQTLWLPLMGTGISRLSFEESCEAIVSALAASPLLLFQRATAVISAPKLASFKRLTALRTIAAAVIGPGWVLPPLPPPIPFSADPYLLPRSAGVTAALELASALSGLHGNPYKILSTTLLFFALAGSQSSTYPALRDDLSARYFAAAVAALAAEQYEAAWKIYFDGDLRSAEAPSPALIEPSQNVAEILHRAKALAGSAPERVIEIDHLIEALLRHEDARLRGVFARMPVDPERLLSEYRDARLGVVATKFQNDLASDEDHLGYGRYAIAIHDFLTHRDTKPPLSISIQAPWGAGKSTLMHLVRAKLDPKAIRERYKPAADDVARLPRLLLGTVTRLLDRREDFSIQPEAPEPATNPYRWLRAALGWPVAVAEPAAPPADGIPADKRRWTIWFNAWKYETTGQIWSGLVDAIVSQIADRLPPIEREKFLLKLHLARIDDGVIRKRIYDRVVTIWWSKVRAWTLAGGTATLALFGLGAVKPALPGEIQQALALWNGAGTGFASAIAAQIILSVYLAGTYFLSRRATRAEPAQFSLADVIRVPDYDKGVGEIHQIHADLRRVLSVVPDPGGKAVSGTKSETGTPDAEKAARPPLVIFIDDLDRCSPGNVASVVEGVSMLLANNDYHCMFVIGMDPQMVAAALEKAHEEVRDKLPSYERAVPLGWRFMDKFVQLPFTIPPSGPDAFKGYVEWLAGAVPVVPKTEPEPDPDPAKGGGEDEQERAWAHLNEQALHRRIPRVRPIVSPAPAPAVTAATAFNESREVGAIIRKIAEYSAGNPREMKRMVNLGRFYLALRRVRRDTDSDWREPDVEQYARWIAVTLRWPDMLRWLQWGADEAHWPPDELGPALVVRRLRKLENRAKEAASLDAWRAILKEELNLPVESKGDWARDSKLFEFFKAEGGLPAGTRLSDAAADGFW
ncbi:MAG: P-loop NTPase fold protein [Pseudomonadota bacterium]